MSFGKKINKEVMAWSGVAIIVVISSLVLLKFLTSNIACPSGYVFNASTTNTCYLSTNASQTASALGNLGTTTNSFLTAFSEPKNWVAIVIIAIIGIGILVFYNKSVKKGMSRGGKKVNY